MSRFSLFNALLLPLLGAGWTPVIAQQAGQLQHSITPPAGMAQESAALGISTAVNGTYTVAGCPFDDIGGQDSGVVKVFDNATGALLHVLVNPTPAVFDYFGFSVAVAGHKVVVGAYLDDTDALNAGIAYVYDLAGPNPSQPMLVLRNPLASASDQFGYAVAASGSLVAVAAPQEDQSTTNTGSVYVYDLDSATPNEPLLTLHNPAPVAGDQFGFSIALDGTHLLAGVPLKDIGASNAGSVLLYQLAGATPTTPVATLVNPHPASSDNFGSAVALQGQRFVVGVALDDATGANAGRAYVYDFSSGYPSTFSQVLDNPNPVANDQYGYSVAVHGARVTVGCPYNDAIVKDSGRAYVYDMLAAQPTTPMAVLTRPGPAIEDRLSLSLAMHGNRVIAAVPYDDTDASNAGALAVFDLGSGTPGTPVALLRSASPAAGDFFGASVCISGTRMVVGARLEDTNSTNAGSAFVYELAGPTPTQPLLILRNPNPSNGDEFGQSVAISGQRVAVSAPYADPGDIRDSGSVYVFELDAPQPHLPVLTLANPEPAVSDQFGTALCLSGERLAVGARLDDAQATNSGSVYVYDFASATPSLPWLTLRNPTPAIGDFYGRSVALNQNMLVVGASADDTGANDAGSAYVYDLGSAQPTSPFLTLNNPEPGAGDQFGYATAVSGSLVVIGANTDDASANDAGSVYVYDLTSVTPTQPRYTLRHPQPMANDQFGIAVAIDGRRVAVSAHLDDLVVNDAGSIHVYDLDSATPSVPELLLAIPGATASDQLGLSVGMAAGRIVTGASGSDTLAWDKGAAFVFQSVITIEPVDIAVEQPAGVELVSNLSTVNFGNALVGGAPVDLNWLIRNAGLDHLESISVSISGTHAADFAVTQTPAGTLAPEAGSGMGIRFTPGAGGLRSAQLLVLSNDPNESPFVVQLRGTGIIPAPEAVIEHPAGSDLTAGVSTVSFGDVVAAAAFTTRTFTLRNTGTANLNGIALSVSGTHASEFTVDSAPATLLAPGASSTFTLRFTPLAGGIRQAKVSVASNDADENPFDIFLSGTGVVFPDLRIEQPENQALINGAASIDFGNAEVAGTPVDRVFTLRNNGTGVLSGLSLSLSGAQAGDYVVTVPPPASIAPGGNGFFTLRFAPTLGGLRQAVASLTSNDPNDSPFVIALTGQASAYPRMTIEQPASNPLFHQQSSVDFGNAILNGTPADVTFTLRNAGTDVLTGISPTLAGTHAADFVVQSPPAVTLNPGQSTTMVLRFLPTAAGDRFGLLRVASNDPQDNPFEIELSGFSVALPQMTVEQPAGSALATQNAEVHFGPANVGQAPLERTFTLRNTGSGELSGITAQFEGSPNGIFSIATFPASILEPGGHTTFTVRFAPSQEGEFESVLRLLSNDDSRSPFDIRLRGTGATVPDIVVEQPQGNNLLASATVVNFGDVQTAQSAERVFTVRNIGNSDLLGLGLSLIGPHAADFTIVTPPPASLTIGESASFVLRFSPSAADTRTATARLVSNDPDENPFDIPLTGKALAVPNLVVEQPIGSPLTHAVSNVAFGSAEVGVEGVNLQFTLRNDGSGGLTGLQAAFSGGQSADFSILTPPSSTLLSGQSTTLLVRFQPSATGLRQTTLNIASNDPARNPFVLTLSGQGVVVPNLVMERPAGNALVSGSASVDMGDSMLNAPPVTTLFTLRNTGTGALTGLSVSFTGPQAADFSLATIPPSSVAAGQSTTVNLRFNPQAAGTRTAVMRVSSNDPDTNPFEIQVSGTGLAAPDITLQQPAGNALNSGISVVTFGSATVIEGFTDRVFTLRNDGTATLSGLNATFTGTGAADFQVLSPPPSSLEPAASATFTVRFAPVVGGDRSSMLSLASNDPDENPYQVTLTGFGVVAPNVVIEQPAGQNLVSGQSVTSFGTVVLGAAPAERVFTLCNAGTGPLTLSSLNFSGGHAADFTVVETLPTTLAPGTSTTFTVRFTPAAAGPRSASARLFSDDPDTNPFVVLLSGEGLALPAIVVEQPVGQPLTPGAASMDFGTVVLNAPPAGRLFTLRNLGTATLSNLSVQVSGDHADDFEVLSFRDTPLAPGESATFNINFNPSENGLRSALLAIGSNDPDHNPFAVALTGTGLALPELQVEQPVGTPLNPNAAVLDFGTVFVGAAGGQMEVLLKNVGTAMLNVDSASFSGSHPVDFEWVSAPATSIAPGQSSAFTLRYQPRATGSRSALLTLISNDPAHPQLVFHLKGESRDYLTEVFSLANPNDSAGTTHTFRPTSGVANANGHLMPLFEPGPTSIRTGELPDGYATATITQQRQIDDPLDPESRVVERLVVSSLKYPNLRVSDVFEVRAGKALRQTQNAVAAQHVIVKPKPGVTPAQLMGSVSLPGASVLKTLPLSGLWLVGFPSSGLDSLPEALTALTATGLIEYAEPDLVVRAAEYYPSTPGFDQQWALHNTGQEGGVPGVDVGAPIAWDYIPLGGETPPIALLDTGVNWNHPAFNGQRWFNETESDGQPALDDDANGYVDDADGWNFAGDNANPLDDNGHGTRLAGIIGADFTMSSNGVGLVSSAWIMPLKVLDASGAGFASDATEALFYATANGARVSCLAWGAYGYSRALQEAIEHAGNNDCLVITAAGNDARDIDRHAFFPATSNADNVITAAAINRHGQLSWFSNYGANTVHLGAPGSDILTTALTGHEMVSGTSAAAAHVAGTCLMLLLNDPDVGTQEVRDSILAGVLPLPSLRQRTLSGGLLRADHALVGRETFHFLPTHPVELTGGVGGPFLPTAATLQLHNPSTGSSSYELTVDQTWLTLSSQSGTLAPGAELSVTATPNATATLLPPGRHTARITLSVPGRPVEWHREVTLVVKSSYFVTRDSASSFPIDPAGSTILPMPDDGFAEIVLGNNASLPFFGHRYRSLFVGSNGYVTFGLGDWAPGGDAESHFKLPRLSALFTDLDPSGGGVVSWRQLADRVVITFEDVPQHGSGELNRFQWQLFFDGKLAITHLQTGSSEALMGASEGLGLPGDFMSSDFSAYPETGQGLPIFSLNPEAQNLLAGDTAQFTAAAEGAGNLTYQWYRNGLPIAGAQSSSLVIPSVLVNQAGAYQVSASNAFGYTTSQSAQLTVTQRQGTVTLQNLIQTHNGLPRAVTVITNPPGLNVTVTYNGQSTPPANAGSYAVAAVIADAIYQGSDSDTLVVNPAAQSIDFPVIADQLAPDTVVLTATGGGSGNPVTFSVTQGPGVISEGNQLRFTSSGIVSITANQAGNSNFIAAAPVTRTFNVSKATAIISLQNLAQTYDGTPRSVTASTTPSGLEIGFSYDGVNEAPVNAGTYNVVATLNPHPLYEGTVTNTLVVAKAPQQVVFPVIGNQVATNTLSLNATGGGSGNPVVYSVVSGPAILNAASTLNFTGAGTVQIAANQAGDANHLPATQATRSFTVTKATTTVTLSGLSQVFDGTPRVVTATTGVSGLNVVVLYGSSLVPRVNAGSYPIVASINDPIYQGTATGTLVVAKAPQVIGFNLESNLQATDQVPLMATGGGSLNSVTFAVTSGPGVIVGATLRFTDAGVVNVQANQAGGSNHLDAAPVTRSVTVTKTPALIQLTGLNQTYDGTERVVAAFTTPADLPVSITYDGNATTPTNAGQYAISAQINHPLYSGSRSETLRVAKKTQTLDFPAIANQTIGTPLTLVATGGSSGNSVTFEVVSGPAVLSAGNRLDFTGVGEVTVLASQAGDTNHEPAPSVSRSFNVMQLEGEIQLTNLQQTYDGTPRAVVAVTQPPGLEVRITYNGSSDVPIAAGSYAVEATLINNAQYAGSASGTLLVAKAPQVIDFPAIADQLATNTVNLIATGGGSGQPVQFAVSNGPAALASGTLLSFTGAGEVLITANQAGDVNHLPAAEISRSFQVSQASATVTLSNLLQAPDGTPKAVTVTTSPAGLPVRLTYDGGTSAPTLAGRYAVNAEVDHPLYRGNAAGILVLDHRADREIATPDNEADAITGNDTTWSDGLTGTYDGLLRDVQDGTTLVGAIEKLTLSRPKAGAAGGAISARLRWQGRNLPLRGVFDAQGKLSINLPQRTGGVIVGELRLQQTASGHSRLTGTLTWNGLSAQADLARAGYHARLNPTPASLVGRYNVLIPSQINWPAQAPVGDGWAALTISNAGVVKVTGRLGDGTPLTETAYLSADGDFSLFAELYRTTPQRGHVGGRWVMRDVPGVSDMDGVLQWRKLADSRERIHSTGFVVAGPAIASRLQVPAKGTRLLTALANTEPNASLSLSGPGLPASNLGEIERPLGWLSNDALRHFGPETISGKAVRTTGLVTGKYQHPSNGLRFSFTGVAFQKQNLVAGHFVAGGAAGAMRLVPGTNLPFPGSEGRSVRNAPQTPDNGAPDQTKEAMAMTASAAGTYQGVLNRDGSSIGGLDSFSLTATGAFTGTIWIEGVRLAIKGVLDSSGVVTLNLSNGGVLTLQLARVEGSEDAWQLLGTLQLDGKESRLEAQRRADFSVGARSRAPQEGAYTLVMLAPTVADAAPLASGDGYATLRVSAQGLCTGALVLPDGARTTFSGHVASTGEWSLHRALYSTSAPGWLAGKLSFREVPGISDVDGTWTWTRATTPSSTGHRVTRQVVGSRYVAPPQGVRAWPELADAWHNAWWSAGEWDRVVTWTTTNQIVHYGIDRLQIKFNASNGLLTGSYQADGTTFGFGGVLMQKQSLVSGCRWIPGGGSLRFNMEPR